MDQYIPIAPSRIKSYQLEGDPYLLHIVELQSEDKYIVFKEDAFNLKPYGTRFSIMNTNEIYTNFEIIL